jgi:hypothetical protein
MLYPATTEKPEQPFSGRITLQATPEVHAGLFRKAKSAGAEPECAQDVASEGKARHGETAFPPLTAHQSRLPLRVYTDLPLSCARSGA